ncbi:hypothetical protein GCM10027449_17000 [Sinomonas notoginsengisoli]|uniref:copper resistance CopC family protein n=1 Tax=Sinomonas notoginsengisoli TaxID=1457311 RepID=UPI001F3B9F79|nr:copper resistance CopC family protein [Sinomonas notoginsengisoli]
MPSPATTAHLPHAHTSLLRTAVAAVLMALTVLLTGPAAQAHDAIEATNPANGSTVQTVPTSVVLTFDHIPIGVGTEIFVKDPTGTNQTDGQPSTVDNSVTQRLKPGAPAGRYTIVWRVVSSDSHPIEGTFTFTAQASGTAASSAAGPAPAQGPQGTVPAAPASASADTGGAQLIWIIIGAAALVLAVAALAFFVRRALRRGSEE